MKVRADTLLSGDHVECSGEGYGMERVVRVVVRPTLGDVHVRTKNHDHRWRTNRMVNVERSMGRRA